LACLMTSRVNSADATKLIRKVNMKREEDILQTRYYRLIN
ncbi:MAG: hypothetical protein K0S28_1383, partial [Paucimonas sp.]|nr:hypothetical protein [Paucimonas sp.]